MSIIEFILMKNTNRIFPVDEDGMISGKVSCGHVLDDNSFSLDDLLDEVSEQATGSSCGFEGISYTIHHDTVLFSAFASDHLCEDEDFEIIKLDHPDLPKMLAKEMGYPENVIHHALATMSSQDDYKDECIIDIDGTNRSVRSPSYPSECDYIRVVDNGLEIGYWSSDEFAEAPVEVLGAMMGALKGGMISKSQNTPKLGN